MRRFSTFGLMVFWLGCTERDERTPAPGSAPLLAEHRLATLGLGLEGSLSGGLIAQALDTTTPAGSRDPGRGVRHPHVEQTLPGAHGPQEVVDLPAQVDDGFPEQAHRLSLAGGRRFEAGRRVVAHGWESRQC